MTADEENRTAEQAAQAAAQPAQDESPEPAVRTAEGESPAAAEPDDPWVGVQEDCDEPYLDPIDEKEEYVYQKGDFLALFLAALKVFAPVILVFIGGIMLVYWFFAR